MTREKFLSNVNDFMMSQSGAGITALEEVLRYIFSANSRADVIFSANQMLIGHSEPDVEEALDSQLPRVLAQALGYSI
jgi:hypothetical protein